MMTGRTGGDRGERWTTALERERGKEEGGAEGCWDDRMGCYRCRCNRLTSRRCHLHHVSSYLFKLSLSIKEGERVAEREAMRTVREMDGEQLDLVRGKQQKVRRMAKVNMLEWSVPSTQVKVVVPLISGFMIIGTHSGVLTVQIEVCWFVSNCV